MCDGREWEVSYSKIVDHCGSFRNNPALLNSFLYEKPYIVRSDVSADDFELFLDWNRNDIIRIKESNVSGLRKLSEEFGSQKLLDLVLEFESIHGVDVGSASVEDDLVAVALNIYRRDLLAFERNVYELRDRLEFESRKAHTSESHRIQLTEERDQLIESVRDLQMERNKQLDEIKKISTALSTERVKLNDTERELGAQKQKTERLSRELRAETKRSSDITRELDNERRKLVQTASIESTQDECTKYKGNGIIGYLQSER